MSGTEFSLLRVRPAAVASLGPPRRRLEQLLEAIAGGTVQLKDRPSFTVPIDSSPHDQMVLDRLSREILNCLSESAFLLIDFGHPRFITNYHVPEWILYSALAQAQPEFPAGAKVYIYLETLPQEDEQLYRLTSSVEPSGHYAFIEQSGLVDGLDTPTSLAVEAFSRGRFQSILGEFRSRFLRIRGVFERPGRRGSRYFKFQYCLSGAVPGQELSDLLGQYLKETGATIALYEDYAKPGWLEPSVVEAADQLGIPWATLQSIADGESGEAIELLGTGSADVVVILPAYSEGISHSESRRLCQSLGAAEPRILTVLMDESKVEGSYRTSWFHTLKVPQGQSVATVDYFCAVPIRTLTRDSWEFAAANALNEVREMSMADLSRTRIGMWTLMADYGCEIETPHPIGRSPISWFPLLRALDAWDAHWLLNELVEETKAALGGVQNDQILLILPEEDTGSGPLYDAHARIELLRAVRIDREVLDGAIGLPNAQAVEIDNYRFVTIVALDESVITGSTFAMLDQLVKRQRGRGCDHFASVLLAGSGSYLHDRPLTSLFAWAPYLVGHDG